MLLELGVCQTMIILIILAHGVRQMIGMWMLPDRGERQMTHMWMNRGGGAVPENNISTTLVVGAVDQAIVEII